MKTVSLEIMGLVAELNQTLILKRQLEKAEKDLKDKLKDYMGGSMLLEAGEFCILREIKSRSGLDKDSIAHDMGLPFILKYTKRTEYETMTVKPLMRITKVVANE